MESEIDSALPDEEANKTTTPKDETESESKNKDNKTFENNCAVEDEEERNVETSNGDVGDCDEEEREPVKEFLASSITPHINGITGSVSMDMATTADLQAQPDAAPLPQIESLDILKEKLNRFLRWCEVNSLTLSEKVWIGCF